jgi:hypothetical protein
MPLDPSIILAGAQPVQQPTLLNNYAQVMQLRQAQRQDQMGAMQLQAAQQAQQDDAKFRQLANPTPQQIYSTFGADKGGKIVKSMAEVSKLGAELQETQAKTNEKTQNIRGHIAYAMSLAGPPTPQTVKMAADELFKNGLKEDAMGLVQAFQQGGPDAVLPIMSGAIAQSKDVQEIIEKHKSTLIQADNLEREKSRDSQLGKHEDELRQIQATRNTQLGTHEDRVDAETAKQHGIQNQYEKQRIANSTGELGVQRGNLAIRQRQFSQEYGAGGEGAGSTPLPGALETMAQQVANGEKKLPRGMKGYTAITARAQFINPGLGDQTYNTVQSFLNADGKESQKLGGITRVLGHVEQYKQDSSKLGYSLATSLGMNVPTNASLHKTLGAVSNELGRLVEQQAITESDKAHWMSGLDSGNPKTRDATIESMRKILGSQFENSWQNYRKATNKELPVERVFDKDTRERLAKFYPELMQGQGQGSAPAVGSGSALKATHRFNPATGQIEAIR